LFATTSVHNAKSGRHNSQLGKSRVNAKLKRYHSTFSGCTTYTVTYNEHSSHSELAKFIYFGVSGKATRD